MEEKLICKCFFLIDLDDDSAINAKVIDSSSNERIVKPVDIKSFKFISEILQAPQSQKSEKQRITSVT